MAEILSIGELLDLGGSASTAGLIPYSALEYSAQKITAISGTAIGGQGGGGVDPATVSAIASSYVESGVSGKVDQSAFDNCCSSMSSVVSSLETSVTSMSSVVSGLTGDYLEKSASSMFQPSGDYAFNSSVSSKLDASASSMFQPSGDYQTAGDYAYNSSLSSKMDASASSQFAPSGDYADKSALSSYVPVSASGQFAPSGDYAYNSALSSKLDASASSQFQPSGNYQTAGNYMSASESSSFYPMTGNPSGFLVEHQSLTAYQDRSSISAWTGDMSSISAKLDQSAFTAYTATAQSKIYTGVDPIVVDNVNDQISLSATSVHLDSSMTAYTSAGSGFIGVNADFGAFVHTADMSGYIPTGESSKYQLTAGMSGYIPTSESSKYYSTGNPSSFATTAQVAEKLDISSQVVTSVGSSVAPGLEHVFTGMNGSAIYAPSATWAANANAAARADQYIVYYSLESSELYDISALRFDKLDASAQVVTSTGSGTYSGSSVVNKINGSAISATYADKSWAANNATGAASAISAQRYFYSVGVEDSSEPISALRGRISAKLDASASSDFYSTSNPSGFLTASYSPTFGYDGDKISSIDGSALAGGGGAYTSPSGTVAIDNENSTIDVWNSSMRVDEHVTAASSFPGTAQQLYSSNYVGQWSAVWTGGTLPGDVAVFSAIYPREVPPNNGYNVRAFGIKEGGGTAQLAEFNIAREVFSPYSGSATASASINEAYTSIYMLVSGKNGVPSTGQHSQSVSGITNVERPAQTAYSTSVYENVLKDSMWQSLTAWAVTQGWTP